MDFLSFLQNYQMMLPWQPFLDSDWSVVAVLPDGKDWWWNCTLQLSNCRSIFFVPSSGQLHLTAASGVL